MYINLLKFLDEILTNSPTPRLHIKFRNISIFSCNPVTFACRLSSEFSPISIGRLSARIGCLSLSLVFETEFKLDCIDPLLEQFAHVSGSTRLLPPQHSLRHISRVPLRMQSWIRGWKRLYINEGESCCCMPQRQRLSPHKALMSDTCDGRRHVLICFVFKLTSTVLKAIRLWKPSPYPPPPHEQ